MVDALDNSATRAAPDTVRVLILQGMFFLHHRLCENTITDVRFYLIPITDVSFYLIPITDVRFYFPLHCYAGLP